MRNDHNAPESEAKFDQAMERLLKTFLDRMAPFDNFASKDGPFWETEKWYKQDAHDAVIAANDTELPADERGQAIFKRLCKKTENEFTLAPWVKPEVSNASSELRTGFFETIASLASRDEDAGMLAEKAAQSLEQLRDEGITGLKRGEVLNIVLSVLGTFRPEASCWFKIRRFRQAARHLYRPLLFPSDRFELDEFKQFQSFMHEIQSWLDDRKMKPENFQDVQGLLWVALAGEWGPEDGQLLQDGSDADESSQMPQLPNATNLILYGPPGTGKTYKTAQEAVMLCDGKAPLDRDALMARYRKLVSDERIGFVTFHQNFSYEDFVEGLRPKPIKTDDGGTAGFELKAEPGIFHRLAELAQTKDGEKPDLERRLPHVLIIDEINRANISKVFGELITLLEPDKRLGMPNALSVTLPYSRKSFGVPANLHIIGTMNTADRSRPG